MAEERLLARGPLGTVGMYRATRDDPGRQQPFTAPLIVFPRTTLRLHFPQRRRAAVIDGGTAIVYVPGDLSVVEWIDGVDRCDFLGLPPSVFEDVMRRDVTSPMDRPVHRISPQVTLAVRQFVTRLARGGARDDGPPEALEIEESSLALCAAVSRASATTPPLASRRARTADEHHLLADRAREVIAATVDRSLGLDELAREVGASSAHLARVFRAECGSTLHRYRTELRLRRTLDELDDDLSAVAQRWGFASHSHLSASFRATFGITPTEARQRLTRQAVNNLPAWATAKTSVIASLPPSSSIT